MSLSWILIEALAVLVENFLKVYYVNSQLQKKHDSLLPVVFMWLVVTTWGMFATFSRTNQVLYDGATFTLILIFIFILYSGSVFKKIIITASLVAIMIISTVLGATVIGFILDRTVTHTLYSQDTSRLISIILIKMIQAIVIMSLGNRRKRSSDTEKAPSLILLANTILCVFCEFLLWYFVVTNEIPSDNQALFVGTSACLLIILFGGFILYEVFSRQDKKNIELSNILQRHELEAVFQDELKIIHDDIKTWRHEYRNSLIAIRSHVENQDYSRAITHIDEIAGAPLLGKPIIETSNSALDAIVNTKLWLANSYGIHVSAKALLSGNVGIQRISDSDLCSILGNLLDNAIEACNRIVNDARKYITLDIFEKGSTLFISIHNSYGNEIVRDGDAFVSSKRKNRVGIGIRYIDDIVNKYERYTMRIYNYGVFATLVTIPIPELDSGGGFSELNRSWTHKIFDRRRHYKPE
jgi:signal transduction histidine kinase